MNINPTLKLDCCNKKKLSIKLIIKKKPKKETDYGIIAKDYNRFFVKCENCGHFYAKHKKSLVKNLYKEKYFISTYKNKEKLKEQFSKIINLPKSMSDNYKRIKRIKKFLSNNSKKNGISLLDVGSGMGVFPYIMSKNGFKVTSIEINKEQCKFLNEISKNKIKVINSDFKIKQNFKRKFDIITMNKVIEHLENPSYMISRAKEYLKKDGIIYIEVPDTLAIKGSKRYLWEEFGLGHYHVFSKKSLSAFIEKNKLFVKKIKSIKEPSKKHTIYCFCCF